jgi:hypothetical protein
MPGSVAGWTRKPDVIGGRMPVVLGYVRRYPWMTESEFGETQHRLALVARQHGRTLGTVHVEDLPTEPQAFEALLDSLTELAVPAVIIPSRAHLGRWDQAGSKYELLRRATAAEIIVADGAP